jgi:hypothetical protein
MWAGLSMTRTPAITVAHAAVALCALSLLACSPTVGDRCDRDLDCGTTLSCDRATPGGYCTRTPCRPGECPPEATCVDFGAERTYCMRKCGSGQGCRSGLTCREDLIDEGFQAFCGIAPEDEDGDP